MERNSRFSTLRNSLFTTFMLATFLIGVNAASSSALSHPEPVVAIHNSELTQALESMPAVPPTPTGAGTTGKQWWIASWHYYVAAESLKEALRSDGTPYVEVGDAEVMAGALLHPDGSPRYPIVISLASEAIQDEAVSAFRNYVSAGGFLMVGSSAFTRNPDGTTRGDFALANEMGLNMVSAELDNWQQNATFSKVVDHRLVSDIPSGLLDWYGPLTSEDIPFGTWPDHSINSYHYVWHVSAVDAQVVAEVHLKTQPLYQSTIFH